MLNLTQHNVFIQDDKLKFIKHLEKKTGGWPYDVSLNKRQKQIYTMYNVEYKIDI